MTSINSKTFVGADVLNAENWNLVNRKHIAKAISELMHELLLQPHELDRKGDAISYCLTTDIAEINYLFEATPRAMGHWDVPYQSVYKVIDGEKETAKDALAFFQEMTNTLEVEPFTLTRFLEETYKTLYADADQLARGLMPVDELVEQDSQTIEHEMTGHPWATVNKGRLGFSVEDHQQFAPETGTTTQLNWVAVHKSRGTFQCTPDLDFQPHMENELGEEVLKSFNDKLKNEGVNPQDYVFIPVHDWQWKNKIVYFLAQDIAHKLLIPMGTGPDIYSAQQSIRTFYNTSNPKKHYVKTAISILNTSVYRGLSPTKLKRAPFITKWIQDRLLTDEFLNAKGCMFLGEVASVAYDHPHYGKIEKGPYQYKDLLGVIWRESAHDRLQEGEKMVTMASLMHTDENDDSFLGACIKKSGLEATEWMKRYFKAYFEPLLHCFFSHGLCFSPHGENTILVMKDYVPVRIIIKDFVEEIHLNQEEYAKAPQAIRDIIKEVPDEYVPLFILSGIFDGVFRYINNVASRTLNYPESTFWMQVRETIEGYQKTFPELADRYQKFDLFMPEFIRVGFNRVRLHTYGYNDNTDIPELNPCGMHQNPMVSLLEEATV